MRSIVTYRRGRPRGVYYSRSDLRTVEYIIELCIKHGIERGEFFRTIVNAWNDGKATCQTLTVTQRLKNKNGSIFLITRDNMVIAQFSIPEHILEDTDPFRGFDNVRERTRNFPPSGRKE